MMNILRNVNQLTMEQRENTTVVIMRWVWLSGVGCGVANAERGCGLAKADQGCGLANAERGVA